MLVKSTDDEENPTGLIRILFLEELYLTITDVDVPTPTDPFGFTVNLIESPFTKECAVDTETLALIFWRVPVTWVSFDSSK